MSKIKYTDFKISKKNFKSLRKICKLQASIIDSDGLNNKLNKILSDSLDNTSLKDIFKKDKEERQKEDEAKLLKMHEVAGFHGINVPVDIFENSDELRAFLMVKLLFEGMAIEKMCKVFLPIYEKIPMDEIAESIGNAINDLSKNK